MWEAFKEGARRFAEAVKLTSLDARGFDAEVQSLLQRARGAAIKAVPRFRAKGAGGRLSFDKLSGIDGAPKEETNDLPADNWWEHMPVRGSFGGELYDRSKLDALEEELLQHGVVLHRDADEFLAQRGIAGGFHAIGPNKGAMYLKSNATIREVLHEMIHFHQFRERGYEGYMKLRKSGQHEVEVLDWFNNNQDVYRLNSEEYQAEWDNQVRWKEVLNEWRKRHSA